MHGCNACTTMCPLQPHLSYNCGAECGLPVSCPSAAGCTPISSTVPEGTAGTAESFTGTAFTTASSLENSSGVSGVSSSVCEAPVSSLQIFQSGSVAALNG